MKPILASLAVLASLTACGPATSYDGSLSAAKTQGAGSTVRSSKEVTLTTSPGEREGELIIEGLARPLIARIEGQQLTVLSGQARDETLSGSQTIALGAGVLTDTGLTLTLLSMGDGASLIESFNGKRR